MGNDMADVELNSTLLALGKAQVDAMFRRQDDHAIDDSEFLPLLEGVLTALETTSIEKEVAEEVWEYAFTVYDRACKEADPTFTTAENRKLMAGVPLGATGPEAEASKKEPLRWLEKDDSDVPQTGDQVRPPAEEDGKEPARVKISKTKK